MLYLVSGVPDCISVNRRHSKHNATKQISRALFDSGRSTKPDGSQVVSLLDVETATYYSELLNISIPAHDPRQTVFRNAKDALNCLETILKFGDRVYCLLREEHQKDNSRFGTKLQDGLIVYQAHQGMFLYAGYYDQPVLDCIGYDYTDQISIENALVQKGDLKHLIGKGYWESTAIRAVTKSLKRLLQAGVIQFDSVYDEYDRYDIHVYYRFEYKFRLTGQPEDGLVIPMPITQPANHNQMHLFQVYPKT